MIAKRDFAERFEKNKLYVKGDEYTFDNKERVNYLFENGYLEEVKQAKPKEKNDGVLAEIQKDEVVEPKKSTKKKSGD